MTKSIKKLILFALIVFSPNISSSSKNLFVKFGAGPSIIKSISTEWGKNRRFEFTSDINNEVTGFFQLNVGSNVNDFLKFDGEVCFRGNALLGNLSYLANIYIQDNKEHSDSFCKPYIGAGIGVSNNTICFIPATTSFAAKAETGLEFLVKDNFAFNLSYRFFIEKYFFANEFGLGFIIKF